MLAHINMNTRWVCSQPTQTMTPRQIIIAVISGGQDGREGGQGRHDGREGGQGGHEGDQGHGVKVVQGGHEARPKPNNCCVSSNSLTI